MKMCKRVGVPVPVMKTHCTHTDEMLESCVESLVKTDFFFQCKCLDRFIFESKRPNL